MYCRHCGSSIADDSVFCPVCGKKVTAEETPPPDQLPPPVAEGYPGTSEYQEYLGYVKDLVERDYQVYIKDYIFKGWDIFAKYMNGFIGYLLIVIIAGLFINYLLGFIFAPLYSNANLMDITFDPGRFFLSIIINFIIQTIMYFILAMITIPFYAGFYLVALKISGEEAVEFADFFSGFKHFMPLFLFILVSSIFIFLGLIFFVIPGIYLSVSYSFAIPLIVHKRLNFWQAMEASRKVVTKKWFNILLLILILSLIYISGYFVFFVGALYTFPFMICALAVAYKDIFKIEEVSG